MFPSLTHLDDSALTRRYITCSQLEETAPTTEDFCKWNNAVAQTQAELERRKLPLPKVPPTDCDAVM